ncbi:MAG: B12-binding domain-containing radical SAM protein [Actinobacteria bacterium]|nr:B12-binding domain-containing radical SAM protein [Actinomycetota bacterium]
MTNCKVILLNPPTAVPSSEILLNLVYLSSTLKKAGHDFLVLDATAPFHLLNEEELEQQILQFSPHFIGVTITITYIPQTYEYLKCLKKLKIPIVAGSPHANCCPEEVLQHSVDIVAIGEGEDTILDLAKYFLGRKKIEDIAGICFIKKDDSVCYTSKRPLIKNLDTIPFPDYDAFPIVYYTGSHNPFSNPIFWSVFSSRGCHYNCIFCSSHNVFGRTYRARSPQNVFQEIEFLAEKYGARIFAFQDDEAFINKDRIIEFCGLVKKSQFALKFSAQLRIDSLDEQMLSEMLSACFCRLAFGIESFNDETLQKINKIYTVSDIHEGFKILEKIHFPAIYFNNIIGFPWETPEHFKKNIQEMSIIPKSLIFFSSTATPIPYPGTKLYDQYHKQYGFTEWWLDLKRNSPSPSKINAFFMLFLSDQLCLYIDDVFWDYSPQMKRAITDFCWKNSSIYLRRLFPFSEYLLIFIFSKISHRIWKFSPQLEKILLYPVAWVAKRLKLDKKTSFIYHT